MKTFAAGLAAAYASGSTTICACLRVRRDGGTVYLFTSADVNVTVGGEVYLSSPGLTISSLAVQASAAVDNMELVVLPDDVSYPQVEILAGKWDNAKFWLFECDYTDTGLASGIAVGSGSRNDINVLKRGTTGEADSVRVSQRFEFRGLKQAWQQPVGAVTSKTCRARLGDEKCLIEFSDITNQYATTSVASRHAFTCSAATEPSDYYGDGIATGATGANAGFSQKIKSFASGVFTLSLPMPFTIGVGDEFIVIAGCRKRLTEDCKDKFNNVLNFQGEPHLTGVDSLTADPDLGGS